MTDTDGKPPYSYQQLIIQAIASTSDRQMTLSGIYDFIKLNYPWYRNCEKSCNWRNSIRYHLSAHRQFIKVAKGIGKGASFWRIDPSCEDELIQCAFKQGMKVNLSSVYFDVTSCSTEVDRLNNILLIEQTNELPQAEIKTESIEAGIEVVEPMDIETDPQPYQPVPNNFLLESRILELEHENEELKQKLFLKDQQISEDNNEQITKIKLLEKEVKDLEKKNPEKTKETIREELKLILTEYEKQMQNPDECYTKLFSDYVAGRMKTQTELKEKCGLLALERNKVHELEEKLMVAEQKWESLKLTINDPQSFKSIFVNPTESDNP